MKKSSFLAPGVLAPATLVVLASTAPADVKYTKVISMNMNGKLSPFSTTTTYLKAGLEREDSAQKFAGLSQSETTISKAATREIINYDAKLRIYTVEKLTGARPILNLPAGNERPTSAPGTGKMVLTLGAQFFGNAKLLNYPVRHWKDSIAAEISGCCGTGKSAFSTETWRADIALPAFNWPREPTSQVWSRLGKRPDAKCQVAFERRGDIATYEKAQKGLPLRSRMFVNGKLLMQEEIAMLSFAALENSVFAVPAGFKKLTRAQYDAARQKALMGGMGLENLEKMGNLGGIPNLEEQLKNSPNAAPEKPREMTQIEDIAPLPTETQMPLALVKAEKIEVRPARTSFDKNAGKRLLEAAKNGDAAQLLAALEAGADPNISGKGGQTALHLAASEGKSDLISKLIQYGANVNSQDKEGRTALMLAQSIGASKPKKSGLSLGSLGKVLGGSIGNKIGGEVLGNTVLRGAAANLLGAMPLEDLLGANLQGLLGASSFDLRSQANWSAIIGTALKGDAILGGNLNVGAILIGNRNLSANDWVNLLSGVKGGNAQVLSAMGHLAGTDAAKNALWNQFLNSASSGNLGAVASLMKNPQLSPLISQALSGLYAASAALPQNSAHAISQILIANGASAALSDKKGQTAKGLATARGWEEIAALLR